MQYLSAGVVNRSELLVFNLQAASKQKLNAWEIIEGLKYPAPLCLAWFGARKTERKLMEYAGKKVHLFHHEHGNKRYCDRIVSILLR